MEHGRISPGRGLCSKPGAGKVRPSSAPLLTHQHPAPGLLRTAATQRKQIEESSTSSRSTGIILHHQQPPPPPPHPPPILRIKHRTAAESLLFVMSEGTAPAVKVGAAVGVLGFGCLGFFVWFGLGGGGCCWFLFFFNNRASSRRRLHKRNELQALIVTVSGGGRETHPTDLVTGWGKQVLTGERVCSGGWEREEGLRKEHLPR